jgi:hypothetical protein
MTLAYRNGPALTMILLALIGALSGGVWMARMGTVGCIAALGTRRASEIHSKGEWHE